MGKQFRAPSLPVRGVGNAAMAITFNCPHCQFLYRLKDELAGKRASCKNPDCRQVILIPQPATIPPSDSGPTIAKLGGVAPPAKGKDQTPLPKAPPPADIESAAKAALSDAPVVDEGPQSIAVTCNYCDHKWEEPIAKAGKNVICPNEECRQRVKVPEAKKATAENWRETSNRPTLAKENFEKPKDVVDAEAKIVSGEAWRKGGGAEQELEPIPLSRRLFFGMLVATPDSLTPQWGVVLVGESRGGQARPVDARCAGGVFQVAR